MGVLLRLLVEDPWLIWSKRNVLLHPSSAEEHPIMRHTSLMACQLSGHNLEHMASWKPGTERQYSPHIKRYAAIWEVKPGLQRIRTMDPLHSISLKDQSLKLVMLMALMQAARVQTLHLLMLRNIAFGEDSVSVLLGGNIKQCKSKFNVHTIEFRAYTQDNRLCVFMTMKEHIERTEKLLTEFVNADGKLLISYIKPYRSVSEDMVARWLKTMSDSVGLTPRGSL
ncbi:uncharacterized protein LOC135116055 [Scylla paramamosain]|uniref:uncharacterized protein LOC135116055 n=1 Tax=Scylla paramamosain TaxID=85552 RepID=UPI003083A2B2